MSFQFSGLQQAGYTKEFYMLKNSEFDSKRINFQMKVCMKLFVQMSMKNEITTK